MRRLAGRLFLSATILLLLCASVFGQGRDLQLTTRIATERYCAVSAGVDALHITLRLRYTNTGNRKLILYKGNRLFYQIIVGHSVEDIEARRYETRTTASHAATTGHSHPGNVFTILSPGASYETEQVIALPIARDDGKSARDTLFEGKHVLQTVVSTWYESKTLAQTLRERWQRRGFLWTDMLIAPATSFNIDRNRSAVVCQ